MTMVRVYTLGSTKLKQMCGLYNIYENMRLQPTILDIGPRDDPFHRFTPDE